MLTYPLNGITYDAEDAEIYLCTRTSGVYAAEGHYEATVTGDREVTIGKGLAWIQNEDYHGKAVYNDTPVAIQIPVADGALPRIDRIVLRFSKSENGSEILLKEGTAASTPTAPEITRTELIYELGLCLVSVGASTVTVSDADITSTLMDEDVCGIMRDGVTGLPTEDLYREFEAWFADRKVDAEGYETDRQAAFEEWFESIKGTLSEDPAGELESKKLDRIGDDTAEDIVTFESGDDRDYQAETAAEAEETPAAWTDVPLITSGETHKSLFGKISTMAKNVRYLFKMIGATDISSLSDGTLTGTVSALNTNIEKWHAARVTATFDGGISATVSVSGLVSRCPVIAVREGTAGNTINYYAVACGCSANGTLNITLNSSYTGNLVFYIMYYC